MTSDPSGDSTAEGTLQTILGWIGVHAAFGQSDDGGCAKQGCGCARLTIVALVTIAVGSWFVSYFSLALWSVFLSGVAFLVGAIVAVGIGQWALQPTVARRLKTAGKVTLGFGAACLLGVFAVMVGPPGAELIQKEVSPEGGVLGPITIEERTWVWVEVEQDIESGAGTRYQRWSFVTAELLDENKNYLSGFGGEFWHYAGYDGGDRWREAEDEYDATIFIPSPGTYYVRLKTEANVPTEELRPIRFEMHERPWWGSPQPLRWAAYAAFFFGAVFLIAPLVGQAGRVRRVLETGGFLRYDGKTYEVRGTAAQYEYRDWKAHEWMLQPTDRDEKRPLYVEYEYEEGSNWSNWALSRPVEMDAIRVGGLGEDDQPTLPEHLSRHGDLPETLTFERRTYTLEDAGRGRRDGHSFQYKNYEKAGGGFLTIEGEAPDELSVVAGESISLRALSVAKEA